ncbi:hypothetical protein J437_LFUL001181 [Ladona fulva]|uniref:Cilia- and flagella-associated protein 52 n=1 Tax=Ladona fulva TaxID=123851 RepID=A0A8K0JV97_LADFU|nr:hypothetical protein J437_LFUL001181 [Ladona fulva]
MYQQGIKERLIKLQAPVSIWDLEKRSCYQRHEVHKKEVVAVAFSPDDRLVLSIGGRDDANVVVWDILNAEALCGCPAVGRVSGEVFTLSRTRTLPNYFVTGGDCNLRVWNVNPEKRNLTFKDVGIGMLKRQILCIEIDGEDKLMYCGTSTGDILKISLNFPTSSTNNKNLNIPILLDCMGVVPLPKSKNGNSVEFYHNGVRAIALLPNNRLVVGAGNGAVDLVLSLNKATRKPENVALKSPTKPLLQRILCANVKKEVTSLLIMENQIIVGTSASEIYSIDANSFQTSLLITCHTSRIYGIAFPYNYSRVFATCGENEIRVWNLETSQELLRICIPNFICTNVLFSQDGKSIVSSWNDGTIRAFTPQTGKEMYVIHNAHTKGVSALDITTDGMKIVSGGCEGQVRIWRITTSTQSLCGILQEHRGPVSSLHIKHDDKEAVSACTDGTCIIWDIERLVRSQIIFANTLFLCVRYHPSGCQILTSGNDHKISYWETFDGSLIREIEASASAPVNNIDITNDGKHIVSGSNDLLVKVWKYNEGMVTHVGIGHAGVVSRVCISPDNKCIVSASSDGAIFLWRFPQETEGNENVDMQEERNQEVQKNKGNSPTKRGKRSSPIVTKNSSLAKKK